MKIAYILNSLNRIAPNTVILNIILNLYKKIDEIYIISMYKSHDDNYKKVLDSHSIKYIEFDSLQDCILNISAILDVIDGYDILHLNQYKPNELGNLLHKFNTNIKLLSTCHSVEDNEAKATRFTGNAKIASIVRLREQRNHYRKHCKVIAVSKEVKNYLHRNKCNNVKVIRNGINYDNFTKIKSRKEKDSQYIHFCQVGHIMNLKNQLYSIKLLRYLRKKGINAKLHLFGKDDYGKKYKKNLQIYITKYKLNQDVIFYNELLFNKLFKKLNNMDIFIMPSLTEGLPLALLEAFYFKLPEIIYNNGGMKEVVKNNVNGLIIDIKNNKDFKRIYNYCQSKTYIKNGKAAKKIALQNFSAKAMAENYLKEYTILLRS